MKKLLHCIFIMTMLIMSCSKEPSFTSSISYSYLPPRPLPSNDTLKGKEFIFSSAWTYWRAERDTTTEEMFVHISPVDFFSVLSMINCQIEISILLQGSLTWIDVAQGYGYMGGPWNPGNSNGYVWNVLNRNWFEIDNYPLNYQLAGTTVKVKVKFP